MVASRCPYRLPFRAAAIRRSISRPVRYSRVRTGELTVFGPGRRALGFATTFPRFGEKLANYYTFFLQYQFEARAGFATPDGQSLRSNLLRAANKSTNLPAARQPDRAGSRY